MSNGLPCTNHLAIQNVLLALPPIAVRCPLHCRVLENHIVELCSLTKTGRSQPRSHMHTGYT